MRLIPEDGGEETKAIKQFFNYRLPPSYSEARVEWLDIVDANHLLWNGISSPKRELIRSFLNAFNLEVVKRLRPTSRFDFSGASIGNLFLTGYLRLPFAGLPSYTFADHRTELGCSREVSSLQYIYSPASAPFLHLRLSCQS